MATPTQKVFVPSQHIPLKAKTTTSVSYDEDGPRAKTSTPSPTDGDLLSLSTQAIYLEDLPSEILAHVFSFLDSICPSEVKFNEQPVKALTRRPFTLNYLKGVSRINRRLRSTVLPLLFAHTQLDPYKLTDFLNFVNTNNLSQYITSTVAILQGPCSHLHPAWWARLLNDIPLTTFTIVCAPHIFAEIASVSITSVDSWAFSMPHQYIRFRQDTRAARQHISLNKLPNLLTARPWKEFNVNEGSSLKAYTTYEYFFRRTPSLVATLHNTKSVEGDAMFASLESFSFTAIFPFYNHVDEILKSVRKMKKLRTLSLKLCPEPESTVLKDAIDDAQGHFDVNDPWNEFDTSYTLAADTVIFLTVEGELQELRVDDVKVDGIRDTLERQISTVLQEWWSYDGNGVWKRTKQPAPPRALAAPS